MTQNKQKNIRMAKMSVKLMKLLQSQVWSPCTTSSLETEQTLLYGSQGPHGANSAFTW